MDKSKELLTKIDGKKEGVVFLVPSLLWVYLQLSPSHENRKTVERYTGKLPFKRMRFSCTDIDSAHPHAHWVEVLNEYWRHHAYHLCRLVLNALEMAEENYGVDIQPLLPHSDVIMYLGQNDKSSVPVGCSGPLSAVVKISARGIFGQDQRVVAAYHNRHYEKFFPFVTNRMNIPESSGESLYISGPNRPGHIFVSAHNATTNPSTGLKNISNKYKVLIK